MQSHLRRSAAAGRSTEQIGPFDTDAPGRGMIEARSEAFGDVANVSDVDIVKNRERILAGIWRPAGRL